MFQKLGSFFFKLFDNLFDAWLGNESVTREMLWCGKVHDRTWILYNFLVFWFIFFLLHFLFFWSHFVPINILFKWMLNFFFFSQTLFSLQNLDDVWHDWENISNNLLFTLIISTWKSCVCILSITIGIMKTINSNYLKRFTKKRKIEKSIFFVMFIWKIHISPCLFTFWLWFVCFQVIRFQWWNRLQRNKLLQCQYEDSYMLWKILKSQQLYLNSINQQMKENGEKRKKNKLNNINKQEITFSSSSFDNLSIVLK